jgi:hypothetical protein
MEKEKCPYSLANTKVLGCMRTCNIFSLGEMTGSRNGIFLYHILISEMRDHEKILTINTPKDVDR